MNNRILKGIALILFGILLCTGSAEINSIILYRFSDFPFAFVGVIIGIVGLVMVFNKNSGDTDK